MTLSWTTQVHDRPGPNVDVVATPRPGRRSVNDRTILHIGAWPIETRATSPRMIAPNHTLESAPILTSPTIVAAGVKHDGESTPHEPRSQMFFSHPYLNEQTKRGRDCYPAPSTINPQRSIYQALWKPSAGPQLIRPTRVPASCHARKAVPGRCFPKRPTTAPQRRWRSTSRSASHIAGQTRNA